MIKLICFLSIIAYATSASVKREEYNPDPLLALTNQVNSNSANRDQSNVGSNSNNSPVYSPNAYPTYSANYGNQVLSNSNQNLVSNYASQPDTNGNQAYVDNVASASSLPSTQSNQPNYSNNNQGNLYYYYYPVQDKSKEINYQASPSNQYASSIVQPQTGDDQSNQNNANLANNQAQVSANSPINGNQPHDLSYGAQDLAYTASALNENSNPNGQQNGNYESQLSNLANAAFGFGGSSGSAFGNSQFANLNGLNNLNNLNFGEAFGGSSIQPSSVPFVNDPAFSAAMAASQLGSFAPATQSTSSGGPLTQLYQQATQMYQGLINGATGGSNGVQPQFASASQQHASYEPSSAVGSSFRSKYGLGSVVLPLMALAGLSLLIPTVTSLSTVASRKKRSAEDLQQPGLDAYLERIDHYYSLYKNAILLEREDCMNRIICELGEAVSGVRGKDAFFDFVERMMPNGWMNKQGNSKISIFKNGASNANNSKCKNYKCH